MDLSSEKLILNTQFSKMELLSKIGEGSYGAVYKVRVDNGSILAVKIVSNDRKHGIRSITEIDILTRIRYPNIMCTFGIKGINLLVPDKRNPNKFIPKPSLAIFMPLADDDILSYILKHDPPLEERIRFLDQIGCALEFLHRQQILHLDLKPDNILIGTDKNGRKKAILTDFGLSIYTDDSGNRIYDQESIVESYRSPEVFKDPTFYSRKADVWAYGIIAVYVLLGKKVFFRESRKNIPEEITRLFHPKVRKKTLDNLFSSITTPWREMIANWLFRLLDINPETRADMMGSIRDPLFTGLDCPKGYVLTPDVVPVNNCIPIFYRGADFLIRVCSRMETLTETVFLTLDLYQRVLHLMSFPTYNFATIGSTKSYSNYGKTSIRATDWSALILMGMSCFWIAYKMLEDKTISSDGILNLSNKVFTIDQLLAQERQILEVLQGIIYRKNLFNKSQCLHKAIIAFESLRNCFIYPRIDLEEWSKMKVQGCTNCKKSCHKFDKFFIQTEYYKWMSGQIKSEGGNYVQALYEKDRQASSYQTTS